MNQVATAEHAASKPSRAAEETPTDPVAKGGIEAAQNAWRRNLQTSAEVARAFQAENADFAGRLLDLNLRVVRSFGAAPAQGDSPLALGASAMELYLGYLGRSTALAQKAIVLPWLEPKGRA